MRGQVALEYMVMFGVCLIIVTVLMFYVQSNTSATDWELKAAYARHAINKIAETANMVYIQGYPSRSTIYVVFPDNVENVSIENRNVIMVIKTGNLTASISEKVLGNVTGYISSQKGGHELVVKSEGDYVNITEAS